MQLEKVLVAGPWVGEFGWELFCWQGYVRALSRNYDKTIIISSKNSKFLYEDYCDQFIDFDPKEGQYKDSFYKVGFSVTNEMWNTLIKKTNYDKTKQKLTIFKPRRIGTPPRTHFLDEFTFGEYTIVPEYLKLGKENKEHKKTIVVHARNRDLRPEDNWPEKKWNILVDKIDKTCYNIVSIGLKKESLHIDGTIDKRECEQQELLDILHNAVCIFGPSSGAMHLASLCGCPQIIWSTDYNYDRYTMNWNPFDSKVVFLSEQGWQPDPEYVYKNYLELINENN